MNKLKALTAACLSAAATTSVMAFEPQADWGDAASTVGDTSTNIQYSWTYDSLVCGSLCQTYNTESGYSQFVYRTPDNSPGASETLTCSIPTTDASGNPVHGTLGDSPDQIIAYSYNDDFLFNPGFNVVSDGMNGGFASPVIGGVLPMADCNLTTDELGKITDGYMMRASALQCCPGVFAYTVSDFTDREFTVHSCTALPDIGEIRAIDYDAVEGGDNGTLPSNCSDLISAQKTLYLTCDTQQECGQFGKSVPVPAFAAAALGLGLLGVSYLTAARRRVKS